MAYVYRPTVTEIVRGRKRKRKARYYRAVYVDAKGKDRNHTLTLPNGAKVADQETAKGLLREILKREERRAAGMVDDVVELASTPMRTLIAEYIRHQRGLSRRQGKPGRPYIKQALACLKWIATETGIERLAHFDADHVELAMGKLVDADRSIRTANVYRNQAHAFGQWLVRKRKALRHNPVVDVAPFKGSDPETSVKKRRRALTHDQARALMDVAGPRQLFYGVQLLTGLRVNETRLLEWRDLLLDRRRPDGTPSPYIQLRAEATKSRRADTVDLHAALARELAAARPPFARPTDRVFKTTPTLKTFKADLKRAGIPLADDEKRTVDRHALRTTFVSWLGQAGVDVRIARRLARHKPRDLTTGTYQDPILLDTQAAVNLLPDIFPEPTPDAVVATGTDPVAAPVVVANDFTGQNPAPTGTNATLTPTGERSTESAKSPGKGTVLHDQPLPGADRAVSSAGQSACLTSRRSQVQVLHRPVRSMRRPAFFDVF